MDLGFFRRAISETSDATAFPLDHDMLTATLQALQAASVTARRNADAPAALADGPAVRSPIVELLNGGPDWQTALEKQRGSFNTDYARRRSYEL